MIFTEAKLKGAFVIDLERREDSRGFFARGFCQKEFEAHGLRPTIAQANVAHHIRKGTHTKAVELPHKGSDAPRTSASGYYRCAVFPSVPAGQGCADSTPRSQTEGSGFSTRVIFPRV